MERPLCLIVNPAAGNGRAHEFLPPARSALTAAGAEHRVIESSSLGHARELAADAASRGEVVVAVGGDGLAGALAGVASAGGASYGLIPVGRGNDLAGVLGIPSDPAAAARVLAAGQLRQIDLIAAGTPGQPEVIVAGSVYAGIPAIAGEIANATRWLGGSLVYQVAALRALARWRPATFTVEIAGAGEPDEFDGYAVVVANCAYFGAGMQVAPPAVIDDGVLDVVLMRHAPKLTFVRALMKIKDGSHVTLPQISLERGAEVTITMSRDLPAAADGEPLSCATPLAAGTPLRIRALPGALSVLVPAG
ncbi:MAG TPA: diacylglycerol kinase family protein [Streptosporangiaceae bacterium]|nr:diacylglycerol kinase family protein [Streptosporangiaceae bacterium]